MPRLKRHRDHESTTSTSTTSSTSTYESDFINDAELSDYEDKKTSQDVWEEDNADTCSDTSKNNEDLSSKNEDNAEDGYTTDGFDVEKILDNIDNEDEDLTWTRQGTEEQIYVFRIADRCEHMITGSYERVLFPLVQKVFGLKSEPHPDANTEITRRLKKTKKCTSKLHRWFPGLLYKGKAGKQKNSRTYYSKYFGCICCQDEHKLGGFRFMHLVEHKKTGIILCVGQECAYATTCQQDKRDTWVDKETTKELDDIIQLLVNDDI
jgi:hypothetical protein